MADLGTHLLVNRILGAALQSRVALGYLVAGALIPDLGSRVPRMVLQQMAEWDQPVEFSTDPRLDFLTPGGTLVTLIVFTPPPKEEERRRFTLCWRAPSSWSRLLSGTPESRVSVPYPPVLSHTNWPGCRRKHRFWHCLSWSLWAGLLERQRRGVLPRGHRLAFAARRNRLRGRDLHGLKHVGYRGRQTQPRCRRFRPAA